MIMYTLLYADIITKLKQYYKAGNINISRVWLCSGCDHYAASYGDKGWGCGYRNLQMLLSCLAKSSTYQHVLFNGKWPHAVQQSFRERDNPLNTWSYHWASMSEPEGSHIDTISSCPTLSLCWTLWTFWPLGFNMHHIVNTTISFSTVTKYFCIHCVLFRYRV